VPFQAGRCEGCGHYDYLEFVWAQPRGAWLCRYCRKELEEEGYIELEDGTMIVRGGEFPPGWNVPELAKELKNIPGPREIRRARLDYTKVVMKKRDKLSGCRDTSVMIYHHSPESWLKALLTAGCVMLPLYRVFTPWGPEGAVYYIFEDSRGYVHVFRGTYGYGGTGPHQSALIEAFVEKLGLPFVNRDGDHLLSLIKAI